MNMNFHQFIIESNKKNVYIILVICLDLSVRVNLLGLHTIWSTFILLYSKPFVDKVWTVGGVETPYFKPYASKLPYRYGRQHKHIIKCVQGESGTFIDRIVSKQRGEEAERAEQRDNKKTKEKIGAQQSRLYFCIVVQNQQNKTSNIFYRLVS